MPKAQLQSEELDGEGFKRTFNDLKESAPDQVIWCLLSIRHILLDIQQLIEKKANG